MKTTPRRRYEFVIVALLIAVAGCGSTKEPAPPSTSISTAGSTASTVAPPTTRPPSSTTAPTSASTTTVAPHGPAVVIRHGAEGHRWIALTFDAGSDTGNTTTVLDLLAARHVRATFSLTGAWARANPALTRRIAREGHVIVNHTDTHPSFTGFSTHTAPLSPGARVQQLERADASIAAITGHSTRPWFRPPYGDIDGATGADVARAGYQYVLLWTVDSLGWQGLAASAVVARCLDGAAPGGILLMHVGSASTDAAALPLVIDGLRARGYDLVTVAEPGFVPR